MNTFFFDDVQYPEGLFGGKDFFNPIIYSTEEREVGVWIDNKPLYAKTYNFNSFVRITNSGKDISQYIDNRNDIEILVRGEGFGDDITQAIQSVALWVGYSTRGIIIAYCAEGATVNCVTLYYTKTTDIAGSAQYTTLGVPAHHYDGNEKIIGTWFGATLYEKTINTTVSPPYSSIDLSSLNINEVVGFEGCSKTSNGDSIPFGYSVASGSQYLVASFEKATSILYISMGSGLSNYSNVFVTIRYTKTS